MKHKLSDRLARMASRMGGEQEMNHVIHVWENPGFVFLSNPICACSTLKLSLNLTVARLSGRTDFAITDPKLIHNRRANLLKTPRQIGYARFEAMLDDPAVTVFAFVRDPQSRFLSAFAKKLMRETPFARQVRAHLGLDPAVPRARFLTPDAFAEAVWRDPTLRDLNGHWRLQRRQVFYDDLPMTTYGRVESFAADAGRLFTRIFGAETYILRDAVTLNPANASGDRKAKVAFSDTALRQIAAAYAPDTAMLAEIARKGGA